MSGRSTPEPAVRPNRIPWPPLLYGTALAVGIVLGRLSPLGWPQEPAGGALRIAGGALAVLGLTLDLWSLGTLHRARTTLLPHRAADRLVTHGPYGLSRNPIYLGNTLLVLGLGAAFANLWLMAAALGAALATDRLAARREEAHLAARFGADFSAYRARVPRWIGRPGAAIPPPPGAPDRS